MSGGEGFSCKPDVLREVAETADSLGQDIVDDASYTAEGSSAASGAHSGWLLAAALDEVQSVWEHNMTSFGEQVSDVAGRLRASARTYEDSDQRNAAGLRGT